MERREIINLKIEIIDEIIKEINRKFCRTDTIDTPNWEDLSDLFAEVRDNIILGNEKLEK